MIHYHLDPRAVAIGEAVDRKEALFERIAHLAAEIYGFDAHEAATALLERESLGSTGFGDGTAIPHGRVEAIRRPVAFVVRPGAPLEYGAIDGEPVDLVFALFSPPHAGTAHLHALAEISRLMRDERIREMMRGAENRDILYAVLQDRNEQSAA